MFFSHKAQPSEKQEIYHRLQFWVVVLLVILITILYYQKLYSLADLNDHWYWLWRLSVFEVSNGMNGILFSLPIICAILFFWWRGALITCLISLIIIFPRILNLSFNTSSMISSILYLLAPVVIVGFITAQLKWREKERKILEVREAERKTFMALVLKAQEDERQRIARELHDDTLQTLLVIATRAEVLGTHENVKNTPQSREEADWIKRTILGLSHELRRLSMDLRPSALDNLGLIQALRQLVEGLAHDEIKTHFKLKGASRKIPDEISTNIFRIVQEILNNIRRHAKATEVHVIVELTPHSLRVTIKDNGTGFSVPRKYGELTAKGKLGLAGIVQRVQLLNGVFTIASELGKGTQIEVEVSG